eukprot:15473550-Alexandrium_andersonii.AAC.1
MIWRSASESSALSRHGRRNCVDLLCTGSLRMPQNGSALPTVLTEFLRMEAAQREYLRMEARCPLMHKQTDKETEGYTTA